MPIAHLRADNTVLVVIDLQDRVLRTIAEADQITHKCIGMMRIAEALSVPTILTEHCIDKFGRSLDAVRDALPAGSPVVEKHRFSAYIKDLQHHFGAFGRPNVLICGIETHICVLQTALDAQEAGRQVFLLTDATGCGEASEAAGAIRRMERCGVIPTGVVSAAYELMEDAKHSAFRSVLEWVKWVLADPKKGL
ncbi:MAG: isochorismatase family protein [Phycisphaerales bacterium]|nr:isochorismatase family protein [Phycisphaerales bacterium]